MYIIFCILCSMSEEERASYEKRRANEIYESMLRTQELAKQRAADVVLEVMVNEHKILSLFRSSCSFFSLSLSLSLYNDHVGTLEAI